MIRFQFIALFLALLLMAGPTKATMANPPVEQATTVAPGAAPVGDLKALLDTLQNNDKREALAAQIKTLIALQEGAAHQSGASAQQFPAIHLLHGFSFGCG